MASLPGYVVPGQRICEAHGYACGRGTRVQGDGILSTHLGEVVLNSSQEPPVVSVMNRFRQTQPGATGSHSGNSRRSTSTLPQINDVVYAQVQRLGQQQVHLRILVVESEGAIISDSGVGIEGFAVGVVHQSTKTSTGLAEVGESYSAVIRVQDIRQTLKDQVKMAECFQPGDIVRAQVLSLGDANGYYLGCMRNDLGVVFARTSTGESLVPQDWLTMCSPRTGQVEQRKCANPFVEN